jgi:Flp pilus assembly protein CpaB
MQMMRSSRGLLVIGGVLAVVAFVLVVVVLNGKSNNATPPVVLATSTPAGSPQPTDSPTVTFGYVAAVHKIAAGTKYTDATSIYRDFKNVALGTGTIQPPFAVNSINEWLTTDTRVLSGTAFLGTILVTKDIRQSDPLLTTDYKVLPVSPLFSLAYQIDAGRVAETITMSQANADNLQILPQDFVDILLTIRQRETDSLNSNLPTSISPPNAGPFETQQLISNVRVVAVSLPSAPAANVAASENITLELPVQDALLLKYVKDTSGSMELVLLSSVDVRDQTVQPKTKAVFPEYFLTPEAVIKGTPQGNGVPYVMVTPKPTLTPKPTPVAR